MKKILFLLFFYIFIFSIHFVFFPIRLRLILAAFGLYYLYKDTRNVKMPYYELKLFRGLVISVFLLWVVVASSSILNSYWDMELFKYPISILISLSAAYCFLRIADCFFKETFSTGKLLNYIVGISIVECIIAIVMFFTPSLKDLVFSVVHYTPMAKEAHEMDMGGVRFMGIGAQYFDGGIFMALALFYMSILLMKSKKSSHTIGLLFAFVFVSAVGSAIARTTLVGTLVSFIYLMFAMTFRGKNKFVFFTFVAIVSVVSLWIFNTYIKENVFLEGTFERAFSVFTSFNETGKIERTGVGDYTKPVDMMTWIIGDAKMADPLNPTLGYYKGIDIGVWRLIWGYGVCGLLAYCLVQLYLCRLTRLKGVQILILFGLFYLFMNKGMSPMDFNLSLLIMLPVYNHISGTSKKRFVKTSAI